MKNILMPQLLFLALISSVAIQSYNAVQAQVPGFQESAQPMQNTVTTRSGLQFQDLAVGQGQMPQPGQKVAVHYTGWLTDGTKFDSSLDRGQPFTFILPSGRSSGAGTKG